MGVVVHGLQKSPKSVGRPLCDPTWCRVVVTQPPEPVRETCTVLIDWLATHLDGT